MKNDTIVNANSSHIRSATHLENEVNSRMNNNFPGKTYTHLNSDFEHVHNLVKRVIDFTQHFHRYEFRRIFVREFKHATRGTTTYTILTNKFKHQYEKVVTANEMSHQIEVHEQGESGNIFDSRKN